MWVLFLFMGCLYNKVKIGLKYSTYTHWKRKFRFTSSADDDVPFAQGSLRTSSDVTYLCIEVTSPYNFPMEFVSVLKAAWKQPLPA